MIKYGRALYYPSIHFQDINWFKTSTLFYDGLDRIVPSNYIPDDKDDIKRFHDKTGFIKNIDPDIYSNKASNKFMEYLVSNVFTLEQKQQELITKRGPEPYRIHLSKLSDKLLEKFGEIITQKDDRDKWYEFSHTLGISYMSFLANEIGKKKQIPVITDIAQSQFLLNNSQIDTRSETEDYAFNLASLLIKSYLPKSIENVTIKQLINFRKNHEAERIRFYSAINDLVEDIQKLQEVEALDEILQYRKKEIDGSVDALRFSLKGLGIETYEGLLGLSIPTALQYLPENLEQSFEIKVLGTAAVLIALGAKGYYSKRKLKNDSPYSFLLSLENSRLGNEALLKQMLYGKIIL